MGTSSYRSIPNIIVAEKVVLKLLKGLNPDKANRPDQIFNQILEDHVLSRGPFLKSNCPGKADCKFRGYILLYMIARSIFREYCLFGDNFVISCVHIFAKN